MQLSNVFSILNRRRIDHRPLQEEHISKEIDHLDYPDKSLHVIESIDSHWLEKQAIKIKQRAK